MHGGRGGPRQSRHASGPRTGRRWPAAGPALQHFYKGYPDAEKINIIVILAS